MSCDVTWYKSEGKHTVLSASYKAWFSSSGRSREPNAGSHSIHLQCTLKYSMKKPKSSSSSKHSLISKHQNRNRNAALLSVCIMAITGLHRTISTGLLPSNTLRGPLAFNLQSRNSDLPQSQHQSCCPTAVLSYILVPVDSISLLRQMLQVSVLSTKILGLTRPSQTPLAILEVEPECFLLYTA